MTALLALIPYRDYFWAALVIGLVAWGAKERHDLLAEGARHEATAVAAVTAQAEAQRAKELAAQAATDQANLKTIEDSYAKSLAVSNANTADLAERLRQYENARSSSTALPGDGATPAGLDAPAARPGSVDEAVAGVISAAGHDADQVIALQQFITKECR